VIDFDSVAEGLSADVAALGAGEVSGLSVFPLPEGRGTRVTFLFAPRDADAADLRLILRGAPAPVWLHRWTKARDGGV
jgi:glucans biosynthesis protein